MKDTWYPAPLTPAELWAAVVETDVAGQVEAATWDGDGQGADQVALPAWDDRYLTEDDRRAWRS